MNAIVKVGQELLARVDESDLFAWMHGSDVGGELDAERAATDEDDLVGSLDALLDFAHPVVPSALKRASVRSGSGRWLPSAYTRCE